MPDGGTCATTIPKHGPTRLKSTTLFAAAYAVSAARYICIARPVPLDQADLSTLADHGQLDRMNECEGMCGV
jgi:hypothetical protein